MLESFKCSWIYTGAGEDLFSEKTMCGEGRLSCGDEAGDLRLSGTCWAGEGSTPTYGTVGERRCSTMSGYLGAGEGNLTTRPGLDPFLLEGLGVLRSVGRSVF